MSTLSVPSVRFELLSSARNVAIDHARHAAWGGIPFERWALLTGELYEAFSGAAAAMGWVMKTGAER